MLDMKHIGELGSHQLAINQALQDGVPFSWLKEFTDRKSTRLNSSHT